MTWPRNRVDNSIVTPHHTVWIVTEDAGRWGI
ncbi:hypothetical protein LMG28688_05289 [Paraburkholderia caffeinitolerans]|uniref:Uncharacterized protein n=1 Tax=Paraburkholderia caffeinitolerans TaxID=1723730 RepID=A0A6J5GIT5_9BURK|nr:hypothetical protein LMG28688_05289 [Paraburkholderia caffeinitolerans]